MIIFHTFSSIGDEMNDSEVSAKLYEDVSTGYAGMILKVSVSPRTLWNKQSCTFVLLHDYRVVL